MNIAQHKCSNNSVHFTDAELKLDVAETHSQRT